MSLPSAGALRHAERMRRRARFWARMPEWVPVPREVRPWMTQTYDVQVGAYVFGRKRVVSIARVTSYERAQELMDGLLALGFRAMIHWKPIKEKN